MKDPIKIFYYNNVRYECFYDEDTRDFGDLDTIHNSNTDMYYIKRIENVKGFDNLLEDLGGIEAYDVDNAFDIFHEQMNTE